MDDADPSRIVCVLRWADGAAYEPYVAWRQTLVRTRRLFEIIE